MKTTSEILIGIQVRIDKLEDAVNKAFMYDMSQNIKDNYEARLDELYTLQQWINERSWGDGNQNHTSV